MSSWERREEEMGLAAIRWCRAEGIFTMVELGVQSVTSACPEPA